MAKAKGKKPTKKRRQNKGDSTPDYSKPLKNPRYEQFSKAYMKSNNMTQAAKDAKYSKKSAGQKGAQLCKIVEIKNRIAYLQSKAALKAGVTIDALTAEFKKIAFGRVSRVLTNKNKIAGLENLGKHIGYYGKDNEQKQMILLPPVIK